MIHTRRDTLKFIGAASIAVALPAPLLAATTHQVEMLSKLPNDTSKKFLFLPAVLQIQPGDTVQFVASNKGHNSVSDKNMLPAGADGWKSKISQNFEITLNAQGTYGYFCQPHKSLGMVGLILVGDASSNYQAAKAAKQSGKAKSAFAALFQQADAMING